MRIFGISYLVLSIILFFVILIASFDFLSSMYSVTNNNQITPIMINYFQSVATWTIIITSITFLISIWYTFGMRSLSQITHWRPRILIRVFGFLVAGYVCEFAIGIYSISHLYSLVNILSSTIIDWSDTAIFDAYISQVNSSVILVDIFGILAHGLIFFGYITLRKWGEGLSEYIPAPTPKYNIERALNFITIGSGLIILADLIGLIPDSTVGGWISIAAIILMVIGFMRAGNLLKGGIPTTPAIRQTNYTSYQYYPPSGTSLGNNVNTTIPTTPVQSSLNQPPMNIPQTQYNTSHPRVCPRCGQVDLPPDAKFCHQCGRIL